LHNKKRNIYSYILFDLCEKGNMEDSAARLSVFFLKKLKIIIIIIIRIIYIANLSKMMEIFSHNIAKWRDHV